MSLSVTRGELENMLDHSCMQLKKIYKWLSCWICFFIKISMTWKKIYWTDLTRFYISCLKFNPFYRRMLISHPGTQKKPSFFFTRTFWKLRFQRSFLCNWTFLKFFRHFIYRYSLPHLATIKCCVHSATRDVF